jgi:hypothetical protein
VTQLKNNARLKDWLKEHEKQRKFLLVEQHRLNKLKKQLPASQQRSLRILDRTCNKFFLVSVEAREEKPKEKAGPQSPPDRKSSAP